MKTTFTPDWKDWIKTNMDAGQDPDGIFKILLDEGYAFTAIVEEMNYRPSCPPWELQNPFVVAEAERAAQARRTQTAKSQNSHGHQNYVGNNGTPISPEQIFIPNGVALDTDKIDLRTVDDFLSEEECEALITRIKSKMRPSSVADYKVDKSVRTSSTCDLGEMDDPFIKDIDDRICKLIGINRAYSEVIQGQYYEVGQEFKAHTDFFDPHEFDLHCHTYGQRNYTVMIYLNDVEQGGETCFRRLDSKFKPVRGKVVIWNSLNPDGTTNMDSLHQANPVEKGYKAVITKWFRSKCPSADREQMFIKTRNEHVPHYTESGIHKISMPEDIFNEVRNFYHENRDGLADEHVPGDFIVDGNKTEKRRRPSSSLVDLTPELRQRVHDALKPLMEEWCGQKLEPTFVYGVREYHNGAVLKMHRDRIDTHIISAIINVDQETDVDWPLVIEDNYYRTHHIMIKPGEVILYEGGRLLHGRPIKFEGQAFANMFCHFKPVGYLAPE